MNEDFVSVIIPAAGRGTRMGKSINKQYISLDNKAILTHTIMAFDNCPYIDEILVVVAANEEKLFKNTVLKEYKIKSFIKISGDKINVTIPTKDGSYEKANQIMRTIQKEFDKKQYITVKYQ